MFTAKLTGDKVVIDGLKKADTETRAGAVDWLKRSTDDLAKDVARHTPVKTGKARDSVRQLFSPKGERGTVTYDYKKRGAWYMRVVLLGAKRHPIVLKLRGIRKGRLGTIGAFVPLITATRIRERQAARAARAAARAGKTRKRALRIVIGGKVFFRASVPNHPGVKYNHILTDRLGANQAKIFASLPRLVQRRIAPFGGKIV